MKAHIAQGTKGSDGRGRRGGRWLTILVLAGLVLLMGMMMGGCGDEIGEGSGPMSSSEPEKNILYQALDKMKAQMEKALEEEPDLDSQNMELEFDSILRGCFLENDKETLLVRFDVKDSPHVAGVDSCFVAIFDEKTGDLITWKYLAGDEIRLHVLPMDTEPDRLICTRAAMGQGQVTSYMEIYQIEESGWKQIDLPEIEEALSELYDGAGNINSLIEIDAKGRVLIFGENKTDVPPMADNGEIQLHKAFMWSRSQKQYVEITPEDVYGVD